MDTEQIEIKKTHCPLPLNEPNLHASLPIDRCEDIYIFTWSYDIRSYHSLRAAEGTAFDPWSRLRRCHVLAASRQLCEAAQQRAMKQQAQNLQQPTLKPLKYHEIWWNILIGINPWQCSCWRFWLIKTDLEGCTDGSSMAGRCCHEWAFAAGR